MSAEQLGGDQDLDPREGDQTEGTTRDGDGGSEQRYAQAAGPRKGDGTEKVEKGGLAAENKMSRLGDSTESVDLSF